MKCLKVMFRKILLITLVIMFHQHLSGQVVEQIDREELLQFISRKNDTTYIINFWATWCSPCVKEITYFEELHRKYRNDKVKVILVSLDFPVQIDKRVVPFLSEKDITADVKLMTDLDYNKWIDLVDPEWSGAIPATLIYNRRTRGFFEKVFTKDELFTIVEQIHN